MKIQERLYIFDYVFDADHEGPVEECSLMLTSNISAILSLVLLMVSHDGSERYPMVNIDRNLS